MNGTIKTAAATMTTFLRACPLRPVMLSKACPSFCMTRANLNSCIKECAIGRCSGNQNSIAIAYFQIRLIIFSRHLALAKANKAVSLVIIALIVIALIIIVGFGVYLNATLYPTINTTYTKATDITPLPVLSLSVATNSTTIYPTANSTSYTCTISGAPTIAVRIPP